MKRASNGECINANVNLLKNWGTSKLTTDDSIARHYCNGPRKDNYELSLALNCVTKCVRYEEELNDAFTGHKYESIAICAEIRYASNERMNDFENISFIRKTKVRYKKKNYRALVVTEAGASSI